MLSIRASLLASAVFVAIALSACVTPTAEKPPVVAVSVIPPTSPTLPTPATPAEILRLSSFATLPGWGQDDLREAWPPFIASCAVLSKKAEWKEACTIAQDVNAHDGKAIRDFFEAFFQPYQVFNPDGSEQGLVTGYYEPLLHGARKRGGPYQTPLYRTPDDLLTIDLASVYPDLKGMRLRGKLVGNKVLPYPSRAELMQNNALAGKELLWVDDSIEAFFLQVQGSGRVQLTDTKETVRVAYADQNGYPYKSIGRYLVDKGELTLEQASAQSIKAWVAAHPAREQELLNANPSYVFFKEEKVVDASVGPKGALGVPLTPQRSIAVDTQYIPLGVPVF
ncbi:MAG TPA: MltA domain-containing protein, partial [Burkholderiaceae bacterium]|nr:MltA domain-containing protein [Burkholderiaceae bacterium]